MTYDLGVVGLGYVGLPMVVGASRAGLSVLGFDTDARLVNCLGEVRSHVETVSDTELAEARERGLTISNDPELLSEARAIIICVPTPLTPEGVPDMSLLLAAVTTVSRTIRTGQLISIESTVYPGATEEILPILEASGLKCGVDFHLAYSPERLSPGFEEYPVRRIPKIVAGYTPACLQAASHLYAMIFDHIVEASSLRDAEFAKLLENTYRHINIALINELAEVAHALDVNIWNAVDYAATKPFGFAAFRPGIGAGGHCVPVDPEYLRHRAARSGVTSRFIELATDVNRQMPAYVADRIRAAYEERSGASLESAQVLILGVAYKPNVSDVREAASVRLANALIDRGARVSYHDPHVSKWKIAPDRPVRRVPDESLCGEAKAADVVVLAQAHRAYRGSPVLRHPKILFDTTGTLPPGDSVVQL